MSQTPHWCWSRPVSASPIAAIVGTSRAISPTAKVRIFPPTPHHRKPRLVRPPAPPGAGHEATPGRDAGTGTPGHHPTTIRPGSLRHPDPSDATVFMYGPCRSCGQPPGPLLDKGISGERIHYEVFGPDLWAQNPDSAEDAG